MSAAKRIKANDSEKTTLNDIKDFYYISINEICERTTYSRRSIERFISTGELKAEQKRGRTVVKISDFLVWWETINA